MSHRTHRSASLHQPNTHIPNTKHPIPNTHESPNPLADLAECYVALGHDFAEDLNWDRAVIWFERALSYLPEDAACCGPLAAAYEQAGRLPEAISTAADALRLGARDREAADALTIIGRACGSLGDAMGAFQAWSALIELKPDRPEAWHGLAAAGQELVRTAGAKRACEMVLEAAAGEEAGRRQQLARSRRRSRCPTCGRG